MVAVQEDLPPDPFDRDVPFHRLGASGWEEFEDEDVLTPIDEQEREAIEEDLLDLGAFEQLLRPRGVRGLVVLCDECHEEHYHDWDMLRSNLTQLLRSGTTAPHEPPFQPDPRDYVSWDYCRGYRDAHLHESWGARRRRRG
ncbi:DUF5319 family protein [Segniliparus rotundus]|uniref:DUF5319 family protein n=1 Tax=Segniliparus rotundus TaxID=286802 RepID=UPI0002EF0B41